MTREDPRTPTRGRASPNDRQHTMEITNEAEARLRAVAKLRQDAAYCARVDALIPSAETYADKIAGPEPRGPEKRTDGEWLTWADRWNRVFLRRMDELTRASGIRTLVYQT